MTLGTKGWANPAGRIRLRWRLLNRGGRTRLRRGVVIGLLLVSQILTATGIPLPAVAAKDRSVPYPCMNHPCGCTNAEQSWRHCCCFTMQEKLAWAEANGVEPPEFVRAETSQTPAVPQESAEQKACGSGGCCCSKGQAPDHSADCEHCKKKTPATDQKQKSPVPSGQKHWVVGAVALRCQGHDPFGLLVVSPALPPSAPFTLLHSPEVVEILRISYVRPESISQAPLTPPPRRS
jgi:hypothetical protein